MAAMNWVALPERNKDRDGIEFGHLSTHLPLKLCSCIVQVGVECVLAYCCGFVRSPVVSLFCFALLAW